MDVETDDPPHLTSVVRPRLVAGDLYGSCGKEARLAGRLPEPTAKYEVRWLLRGSKQLFGEPNSNYLVYIVGRSWRDDAVGTTGRTTTCFGNTDAHFKHRTPPLEDLLCNADTAWITLYDICLLFLCHPMREDVVRVKRDGKE